MKVLTYLILALCPVMALSQPLDDRYRTEIFDTFTEVENVLFSTDVPQPTPGGGFYELITGLPLNADETDTDPVDLYLDIFMPDGDTLDNRPAIVIFFGGGFLNGSAEHWSIVALAQELAKRGFVTVTPDYRLGMNIFDQDLATRSVYRGVQDGRAAIKYLRANSDSLGIDPDQIYIGGHSAGAFIALHNLYMDTEEERPVSTYEWIQGGDSIPDLGCLDCTGIISEGSGHANSAFSLAGAIGFLSYIDTSTDGRTSLFHSQDDGTVPYDVGEPFSNVTGLVLGSDLPTVYGSSRISLRCDTVELPDTLYSYANRGHGVHEDGDSLYDDIIPAISDWFYQQRLKPEEHSIVGPTVVCADDLTQTYSVEQGDAVYYDWQLEGGTFVEHSTTSNEVVITWSDTAVMTSLTVTPYNAYMARGAAQTLDIEVGATVQNTWLGGSGDWGDPAKWSLGHVPTRCESVVIEHVGSGITVTVEQGALIFVRSLETVGDVELVLDAGALIEISAE